MSHVFTYGSLMFAEVWSLVVAGRYASVAATLGGHARHAIRDETYPGMVVSTSGSVAGVLYLDVDAADLERLDRFEGEDYRRTVVTVASVDGVAYRAGTYVYRRPDRLLDEAWRPEAFALQTFLDTYCPGRVDP